jgi:hypothetical protein
MGLELVGCNERSESRRLLVLAANYSASNAAANFTPAITIMRAGQMR